MSASPAVRKFLNHLKFLGYTIEERDGETFSAKHEWLLNMFIEEKPAGIFFYAWISGNTIAAIDKAGFLECVNSLNAKTIVLRFYADKENDLVLDAWYPKPYNRIGFAAFMDLLNHDMRLLFRKDCGVETYCG